MQEPPSQLKVPSSYDPPVSREEHMRLLIMEAEKIKEPLVMARLFQFDRGQFKAFPQGDA